ncbi:hypothetical protein AB5I41_17320 [Sphingomonas sp. MMS24-JH45]
MLAAHHAQAALLNWKGTSHTAVPSAPRPSSSIAAISSTAATMRSTDWAPSNGVAFTQNSAMFGAWFRKGDRNGASPVGTQSGTTCAINPRSGSDVFAGRVNTNTVASAGSVATGYGLSIIDRSTSTSTQLYRDGLAIGSASTGTSLSRVGINMGSGRWPRHFRRRAVLRASCRRFAECGRAPRAGRRAGGLYGHARRRTAAGHESHADDDDGLAAARWCAAGRDGSGNGRDGPHADPIHGCWWIGNGFASAEAHAGVSRACPDLTTVLGAFDVAGWGLASSYNGSVQGVTFDTSDATLWAILKATSGGGSFLLHIARDGALIGAPVAALPQASSNGLAYDPATDFLAILYDGSPATVIFHQERRRSVRKPADPNPPHLARRPPRH